MKNNFLGALTKRVFAQSNNFCKHEVVESYAYFASSFFFDDKNNLTKVSIRSFEIYDLINLLTNLKLNDKM